MKDARKHLNYTLSLKAKASRQVSGARSKEFNSNTEVELELKPRAAVFWESMS